ncbi:MAG: metal ABC transporter permease [Chloroflexi bacterium]|nr:metal ABC transporter permease [Chloroflexota bacterium]
MDLYVLWQALIEPLQFAFIQRGIVEVVLMGAVCGAMGAFVIARGWGFIGDAIAHAVFPGVVIAYLGHFSFFLGALAFGALTAIGVGAISRSDRLKEDTAIGILFAGMFALGVVLISSARSYTADLGAILFGNVLGVSDADLLAALLLAALASAVLFFMHKELVLVAFDRTMAAAVGLPVVWLDLLLLLLLTLTIVVSLQAVGNILVVAMLITPAATARLYVERFHTLMLLGALIGALCGAGGLYLSYHLSLASGGTIVLLTTAVFLASFIFSPKYGWIVGYRQRQRLARTDSEHFRHADFHPEERGPQAHD